jgi:CheY-like chemotaxis protein
MKSRILVVDDDKDAARHVRSILLRQIDCEVELAFDGGEAIVKAAEGRPDLVLLDVQLPVLDGFEVLSRIKAKAISTRVIMFSAYRIDIATAVRAIKEGACDYLTKPIAALEIVEHIKRSLVTDSTINLHLASGETPLMQKLWETLDKISEQEHRGGGQNLLGEHYIREPSLKDRFAKHWFISLICVCAAVATVTWQLAMNLYVHPRDFELERLKNLSRTSPSPSITNSP